MSLLQLFGWNIHRLTSRLHSISLPAPVEAAAKKHSRNLSYYQCNVRDAQALTDTFAKFVPQLQQPLRGLVSCAGVSDNGPAVDFPVDSFRRMYDINVVGTFLVAQAVAKELLKTQLSGSMVFVASMSGYVSNKVRDSFLFALFSPLPFLLLS